MRIEFKDVTMVYGSKIALNKLNVTLEKNKIYGLLGRNGAGKTTMLQLLAGHILPTKGSVLIDGQVPFNQRNVLDQICLVNESSNFKRRLKINEVLKIASLFYSNWSKETADRLLKVFHLDPKWNAKGLSKGMESALGIIIGLSSRANVTVLDEPYIGLDASLRYTFYDTLLEEFGAYPRTFILSTHLIDEVSNLFDEIVLIKDGKLHLHKPTDELKDLSLKIEGKKEVISEFCKGKKVIYESEIMGRKTALLFGENYKMEHAEAAGIHAERCQIQELIVHLTSDKEKIAYV